MVVEKYDEWKKMYYANIFCLKMPWAILLVALTLSNAVASSPPGPPPPPPPTIAEIVGGSTDIVVGQIERFLYRSLSSPAGNSVKYGREFDEPPANEYPILEAVVRVNKVLYWKPKLEFDDGVEKEARSQIRVGDLIHVQFWRMNRKRNDMIGKRNIFVLNWHFEQFIEKKFFRYTAEQNPFDMRKYHDVEKILSERSKRHSTAN